MDPIYAYFRLNFLYVDRYRFSDRWYFPESEVPYCMYRLMMGGRAAFTVNGRTTQVQKGDVFYIPGGSMLSCQALEEVDFYSIRFAVQSEQYGSNQLGEMFSIPCLNRLSVSLEEQFERVYRNAVSSYPWKMLNINAGLLSITAALAENAADSVSPAGEPYWQDALQLERLKRRAQKSRINQDPRLAVVVDYMITHPQETPDITAMCEMAGVSESTLRRLFKRQTGKLPVDFIKEMRMMNAARLLLTRNDSVAEIAYQCGYETSNYFSRCFKTVFGVSPGAYRKRSGSL